MIGLALYRRWGLEQRNLAVFWAALTRRLLETLPAPSGGLSVLPVEGQGLRAEAEAGLTSSTVPHVGKVAAGNEKIEQAHGCVQKPKFTEQAVGKPGCQRLVLFAQSSS